MLTVASRGYMWSLRNEHLLLTTVSLEQCHFCKQNFRALVSSIVNSLVTLKTVDLGFKAVVFGLVDAVGLLLNDNPIQPVLENSSLQPLTPPE